MRLFVWLGVGAVIAALCLGPAAMAAEGDLTLKEAIQKALITNPQALGAMDAIEAAGQDTRRAWGGWFPKLDLRAGYGYEKSENPALDRLGFDSKDLERQEASLTLRQLIFDGMGVQSIIDQRAALEKASGHRLTDVQEVLAVQVLEAYLGVLEQRSQVKLAEENEQAKLTKLREIKERLQSGVGRRSDVDQVNGRLASAKTILVQRKKELLTAETSFKEVVGVKPAKLTMPASVASVLPKGLEGSIKQALENHPAIARRMAELEAAQAEITGATSNFWPRFEIQLDGSRNRNLDGVEGKNNDERAMVNATWNLFNGGSDFANRLRLIAVERENREGIAGLKRVVTRNSTNAWNALMIAREDLNYLKEAATSEAAVVDAFEAQFGLGKRTLLDLLNAQDNLYRALSAELTGRYAVNMSEYQVLSANAVLNKTLKLNTKVLPRGELAAQGYKAVPAGKPAPPMKVNKGVGQGGKYQIQSKAAPAAKPVAKAAAPAKPAVKAAAAKPMKVNKGTAAGGTFSQP